jgi:NhaA family Na+:H+ antiporter
MILTKLYKEFFSAEKTSGLILVLVTIFSLVLANSSFQQQYISFWNLDIAGHTLVHWINDGLMTIFFLLIGLELEREIYDGELSNLRNASLPFFAAIGGMVVPAFIFMWLNYKTPTQSGAGIPMATDIAFAIGILALLGKKVPASLKIFLTALAVIDDLGAIIVIAVFYSISISFVNLAIALGTYGLLIVLNRMKVYSVIPYLIGGVVMWYFMLNSGVHPTITGVLLAFAIPYGKSKEISPSHKIQHFLHKPVAFLILPLFALANTGIIIHNGWQNSMLEVGNLGVILGLFIGKPLGISLFAFLSVKLKIARLPHELKWKNIIGVGFLGGIGFTMSIFITLLAYPNHDMVNEAEIAILLGSIISAITGLILLKIMLVKTIHEG